MYNICDEKLLSSELVCNKSDEMMLFREYLQLKSGEGWLGWERAGFRIGKDKDRGSALGITMGIVTCPMEKGIRGAREGLG